MTPYAAAVMLVGFPLLLIASLSLVDALARFDRYLDARKMDRSVRGFGEFRRELGR